LNDHSSEQATASGRRVEGAMPGEIGTIGHSNREPGEFRGRLAASAIGRVADGRRFPGPRRHPHFNREALDAAPGRVGSGSRHCGDLGGRRDARPPRSPHTAWRVEAFHACADSRATPPFAAALDERSADAERARTAILGSEAVPWRCHRRRSADAPIVRGGAVRDILGPRKVEPHALTDVARVRDGRLTYPAEPLLPEG